jgi:hypothetical protein
MTYVDPYVQVVVTTMSLFFYDSNSFAFFVFTWMGLSYVSNVLLGLLLASFFGIYGVFMVIMVSLFFF